MMYIFTEVAIHGNLILNKVWFPYDLITRGFMSCLLSFFNSLESFNIV